SKLPQPTSRTIRRVVMNSLQAGGRGVADRALEWLIANPANLRHGNRRKASQWELARRLIRRFALHCSDETYKRLEDFLLSHHDSDEWDSIRWKAESAKKRGYYTCNLFGQVQYHLL